MISIAEAGAPTQPPVSYDVAVAAEARTPVLPPELVTQVSVTVTWALA